jgi:hypothetical protein
MCPVLKLDPDTPSEDRELEFELAYQRGLTTPERFEMMFRRSRRIMEELARLNPPIEARNGPNLAPRPPSARMV